MPAIGMDDWDTIVEPIEEELLTEDTARPSQGSEPRDRHAGTSRTATNQPPPVEPEASVVLPKDEPAPVETPAVVAAEVPVVTGAPSSPVAAVASPVQDMTTAFAQALREAGIVASQQQPQQQQPLRQMTQDEIDEQLAVWKATDDWKKRLLDPDTMADAIVELQQATIKQALRMSDAFQQDRFQQLQQTLTPLQEYYNKAQQEETRQAFAKQHPLFSEEKYKPLLRQSFLAVQQSGKQFDSREAVFDAIAQQATAAIQSVDPNFGKPATPVASQQPSVATLPKPTGGASGGAGGSGGAPVPSPKAKGSADVTSAWG